MAKVTWQRLQITLNIPNGCDFQDAALRYPEMPIKFGCRQGNCGVCAIEIVSGMENLTRRTPEETATINKKKLSDRHRLGCQCAPNGCGDVGIS